MAPGIHKFNVYSVKFAVIPTMSQINPIPHINANFFEMYSNIVLPSMVRPSYRCTSMTKHTK